MAKVLIDSKEFQHHQSLTNQKSGKETKASSYATSAAWVFASARTA